MGIVPAAGDGSAFSRIILRPILVTRRRERNRLDESAAGEEVKDLPHDWGRVVGIAGEGFAFRSHLGCLGGCWKAKEPDASEVQAGEICQDRGRELQAFPGEVRSAGMRRRRGHYGCRRSDSSFVGSCASC